jgi:hypothetical protein
MVDPFAGFWMSDLSGRRGIHGPDQEWLVEHVRDGWDIDLPLGESAEWIFSVTRIECVAEGMRVVMRERFGGTVEEYAALDQQRFYLEPFARDSPPPELWRFGVEYSDGTRITTVDYEWLRRNRYYHSPDIAIAPLGASGHISDYPKCYWFAPAPPPGPVVFALEWPLIGLPFTTATIDLHELQTAPRTPVIWPDTSRLRIIWQPPPGNDRAADL